MADSYRQQHNVEQCCSRLEEVETVASERRYRSVGTCAYSTAHSWYRHTFADSEHEGLDIRGAERFEAARRVRWSSHYLGRVY